MAATEIFAFQQRCAAPIFGYGTATLARHYIAYLNDNTASIDPYALRKATPAEEAQLRAGQLHSFDIAIEIERLERRNTAYEPRGIYSNESTLLEFGRRRHEDHSDCRPA